MAIEYEQQLTARDERIAELERELAEREQQLSRRTQERDEARREVEEGQRRGQAVADILKLPSAEPADQQAVFQAMLQALLQLNGGGTLYRRDRDVLRHLGTVSDSPRPPAHADGQCHPELNVQLDRNDATLAGVEDQPPSDAPPFTAWPRTPPPWSAIVSRIARPPNPA